MTGSTDIILAAILLTNIVLAASSRLMSSIKTIALQGLLIGLLPLALWNWGSGAPPHSVLLLTVGVNIAVKSILLPTLLVMVMRRTNVKREFEPFIGYPASVAIIMAVIAGAFYICSHFGIISPTQSKIAIPTALTTLSTGLFIIIARRKAITQVIGFLVFENGIGVFGIALMLEHGLIVELGILLDVLVLVFIMGIAIFHINREFSHINADRLTRLGDMPGRHKDVPTSPPKLR